MARVPMESSAVARKECPEVSRASLLPAPVTHFFSSVVNRGGGGASLFQDMDKRQALVNQHGGGFGVHLGTATGKNRGRSGAFILDHGFVSD